MTLRRRSENGWGFGICALLVAVGGCTPSQTLARDDVPSGTVRQEVIGVPLGIRAWTGPPLVVTNQTIGDTFGPWAPAIATDGDRFLMTEIELPDALIVGPTSPVMARIVHADGSFTSLVPVSPGPPSAGVPPRLGAAWAGGMFMVMWMAGTGGVQAAFVGSDGVLRQETPWTLSTDATGFVVAGGGDRFLVVLDDSNGNSTVRAVNPNDRGTASQAGVPISNASAAFFLQGAYSVVSARPLPVDGGGLAGADIIVTRVSTAGSIIGQRTYSGNLMPAGFTYNLSYGFGGGFSFATNDVDEILVLHGAECTKPSSLGCDRLHPLGALRLDYAGNVKSHDLHHWEQTDGSFSETFTSFAFRGIPGEPNNRVLGGSLVHAHGFYLSWYGQCSGPMIAWAPDTSPSDFEFMPFWSGETSWSKPPTVTGGSSGAPQCGDGFPTNATWSPFGQQFLDVTRGRAASNAVGAVLGGWQFHEYHNNFTFNPYDPWDNDSVMFGWRSSSTGDAGADAPPGSGGSSAGGASGQGGSSGRGVSGQSGSTAGGASSAEGGPGSSGGAPSGGGNSAGQAGSGGGSTGTGTSGGTAGTGSGGSAQTGGRGAVTSGGALGSDGGTAPVAAAGDDSGCSMNGHGRFRGGATLLSALLLVAALRRRRTASPRVGAPPLS